MNLLPDLFSFAYVPGWYCQLNELTGLALPEPWRFRNPDYYTKNTDTPILKRYIYSIFKNKSLILTKNGTRRRRRAISMWRMNLSASIPACIHAGTRQSMTALTGTSGRVVGRVNVTTKRTWQCTEKNALSILRVTQNIHGGDLNFDCRTASSTC